jgi:hypothetical protein
MSLVKKCFHNAKEIKEDSVLLHIGWCSKDSGFIASSTLVLLILLLLVMGTIWVALADDVADEEAVNNGTKDLVIIRYNHTEYNYTPQFPSPYYSDESVKGEGFANINDNLAIMDERSPILDIKNRCSGTGSYSYASKKKVMNNIIIGENGINDIDYDSTNRMIRIDGRTNASYSEINFKFPGSFRTKAIRSLWKDQITSRNYAGIISMNYLFDYAKSLNFDSTATMTTDSTTHGKFLTTTNSTIFGGMNINGTFAGTGHIGATTNDLRGESLKMKDKTSDVILIDEDYKGSFKLNIKNMEITMMKSTDLGDTYRNFEGLYGKLAIDDYPWLPCMCNMGWNDMIIHDQRYHSAKDFFDCKTCWPPAPLSK